MKLNKSLALNSKTFFYVLIGMVWCRPIIMQYFRVVLTRLPILNVTPDGILAFLYIAVILLAFREMKIKVGDFVGMFTMLVIYLLSPIIFPNTFSLWSGNAPTFIFTILPMFLLGSAIGKQTIDFEKLMNLLYVLSSITVVVRILYFYTSGTAMTTLESLYDGDMSSAYYLLPHLCLIMYFVFKKKTVLNVALLLIGSVFLMFLGTRGAVLMELICFVLMVLLFAKWKYKGLKIVLIATAVIIFLYSPLLEVVIKELYTTAYRMGLSVRIFDRALAGELTASDGRQVIADTLYKALAENPLGYGVYGDSLFVGSYAHKIYLELWIQFGVILGTIFCGLILIIPVRAFFKATNSDIKGLLVVLYCSSVLKLFLSSSYLREEWLFFILGLSISLMRKNRD